MLASFNKILVLAPHTDDGELGCGGTITHFITMGKQVSYAAFSICEGSLPPDLPPDTLAKECKRATAALGIAGSDLKFYHYPVRAFPDFRQEILEDMVKLNNELQPDLVFIPSAHDIHQDHQVVFQEGQRAFKQSSLAGYELPWNNSRIHTDFFVKLSASEIEKKIKALESYSSQSHRNYMQPDFIRSLATIRGVQCNAAYAEAFEIYKLII